jgi:hypothetical protein
MVATVFRAVLTVEKGNLVLNRCTFSGDEFLRNLIIIPRELPTASKAGR